MRVKRLGFNGSREDKFIISNSLVIVIFHMLVRLILMKYKTASEKADYLCTRYLYKHLNGKLCVFWNVKDAVNRYFMS